MMNRLTLRYGLLRGMGKHCPVRRLKRVALIGLLVAAALYAASLASDTVMQLAQAQGDRSALRAQLTEAQRDREDALAILSGKVGPVDVLANGTRVYTRVKSYEERIKPVMVAAK